MKLRTTCMPKLHKKSSSMMLVNVESDEALAELLT